MSSKDIKDIYEIIERIIERNELRKEAEKKLDNAIKDIESFLNSLKKYSNQVIPINGLRIDIENNIKKTQLLKCTISDLESELFDSLQCLKY